ncbi:MAG: 3-phosphoshikimate 1-carboxyvinyltransferase [Microbacteriaceae bacterium]|nr:3-phosphoshikimate 1-carboxyvinyltransferase [Microbacteriaceae bacterium]
MTYDIYSPPRANAPINARVLIPGSKSLTNRELVLSALADAPSEIVAPLYSRDSELMMAALGGMGVEFDTKKDSLIVTPPKEFQGTDIDCGLAGTVMRFLPPLAALGNGAFYFDGDPAARTRPMKPVLDALSALSVKIDGGPFLPFTVHGAGEISGGEVEIDASGSSQFVSALLLSGARFKNGLRLIAKGDKLPSKPHIDMTLESLRVRGVSAAEVSAGVWEVKPGPIAGIRTVIEPDLSNAAPFLAATVLLGGTLRIPHWPKVTTQVGEMMLEILEHFGGSYTLSDEELIFAAPGGEFSGIDIDLSTGGELAPTVITLAALASTPSRITGIGHIRGHETDRLKAMTTEINALGGNSQELEDGIEVVPSALTATGRPWHSYDDHRIATSGALMALRVSGLSIENIGTTAKTLPNFTELWEQLLYEPLSYENSHGDAN